MLRIFSCLVGALFWRLRKFRARLGKKPEYILYSLEGEYSDLQPKKRNFLFRLFRSQHKNDLQTVARIFDRMTADLSLKGLILHLGSMKITLSQAETLRGFVDGLRQSGKRVYAWSNQYTDKSYFIACGASEIFLQPGGMVHSLGQHRRFISLQGALANAGIAAELLQTSPYKSSIDMFTKEKMSDEVREMGNWLLDHAYNQILWSVASARNMELDLAKSRLDQTPCGDVEALELKLVDRILTEEDLSSIASIRSIRSFDEASSQIVSEPNPHWRKTCALLPIEGMIVDGHSRLPPVKPPFAIPYLLNARAGDRTIIAMARKAMKDPRIGAVVVYVNSPGGTLTASEAIRAALENLAARKPVVVAMGSVAASGGYWVSTAAHKIVALRSTLTGSIGVVSGKFVMADLFQKIGIRTEILHRGAHGLMYEVDRTFTAEERKKVKLAMDRGYELFVERVSAGRKIDREALRSIGEGRVWTGAQAKEKGLVDELGDLAFAVALAKKLAKLPPHTGVKTLRTSRRVPAPHRAFSAIEYAAENLEYIQKGNVMALCPILEDT